MTKRILPLAIRIVAFGIAMAATLAQAKALPGDEAPANLEAVERREAEGKDQEANAREKMREVLASPDFFSEQTMRVPSLKKRASSDSPDWMKYVENFARFLARILRAGVWILGGIAVLIVLFTLHRWWRMSGKRERVHEINIPTHVGELDIRAESLPEDVGAAARRRWQGGDIAGCLSLLYRGALSALVLCHEARIRSSYTEAECLHEARPCLPAAAFAYFDSLTRAWLQTVYAGRRPDDATGLALCDGFATHFPSGNASVSVAAVTRPVSGATA